MYRRKKGKGRSLFALPQVLCIDTRLKWVCHKKVRNSRLFIAVNARVINTLCNVLQLQAQPCQDTQATAPRSEMGFGTKPWAGHRPVTPLCATPVPNRFEKGWAWGTCRWVAEPCSPLLRPEEKPGSIAWFITSCHPPSFSTQMWWLLTTENASSQTKQGLQKRSLVPNPLYYQTVFIYYLFF